jgi:hypothetical protein
LGGKLGDRGVARNGHAAGRTHELVSFLQFADARHRANRQQLDNRITFDLARERGVPSRCVSAWRSLPFEDDTVAHAGARQRPRGRRTGEAGADNDAGR